MSEKDLLRFTTTGSVDDGKSTLIGRLLYETDTIPEDQYEAAKKASKKRGKKFTDLSLLLDGLESEREQGITIDVAYRYFETKRRKFIVADTPGHEQYTRNMVTGASNSDLAIILIDASQGVLTQSKRHGFLNSLLGIPHLIVAVNKMDLVNYDENVFKQIVKDYQDFSTKLKISDITFIPISALKGGNCVKHTSKMKWYHGPTVLEKLEEVHVASARNLIDFRFPVQMVVRPDHTFRGFAGKICSGVLRPGTSITVLPSGQEARIESILLDNDKLKEAYPPQSVVLTLNREIDISRGDMIVRTGNSPHISELFVSMMCWMSETPLDPSKPYFLKHTTQTVRAKISHIIVNIDVNTLRRKDRAEVELNDIFKARIETTMPLFFDEYIQNRETGCFILIDPESNNTVACGMISKAEEPKKTRDQKTLKERFSAKLYLLEKEIDSGNTQQCKTMIEELRDLLKLL